MIQEEIHDANTKLKIKLVKLVKTIRSTMKAYKNANTDSMRLTQGRRLRKAWARLGVIEQQIIETNQEMAKRVRKLVVQMAAKMDHFESEAEMLGGFQILDDDQDDDEPVPRASKS